MLREAALTAAPAVAAAAAVAGGAVVLVGPAAVVLVQGSRETPLTSARPC